MRVVPIGVLLLLGWVGLGIPARAQGHFAVAAGLYEPEDKEQERTEVFELRGGYRVKPQVGFEWSLSKIHLTDTVPFTDDPTIPGIDFDSLLLKLDLYNLDVSVQWFPGAGNFVVFGGPGLAQLDSDLIVTFFGSTFTEPDRTFMLTAHAGVGYVWNLNKHFYLEPEVRVRHYFGYDVTEPDQIEGFYYSYKATDYQAGLTFGWKFGP
ncbi:MAG TPA: outer membrane beta-barrel protein [Thermoanaerobaculia bacterium]|jgi:hypothetical protein|nr:outer membrane beta-barrel protein [Thermoanaerobaculia bacterium]